MHLRRASFDVDRATALLKRRPLLCCRACLAVKRSKSTLAVAIGAASSAERKDLSKHALLHTEVAYQDRNQKQVRLTAVSAVKRVRARRSCHCGTCSPAAVVRFGLCCLAFPARVLGRTFDV